jgi:hypothetical protein
MSQWAKIKLFVMLGCRGATFANRLNVMVSFDNPVFNRLAERLSAGIGATKWY